MTECMSTGAGRFALLAGTAIALAAMPQAHAQSAASFPSKSIVLIVPFAAGGPVELETRLYTQRLAANLGQQVLIDFKPGGGSMLGIAYVAKSRPDGYTLVAASTGLTVIPAFRKTDMPYDTMKDLTPISLMSKQSSILLVHPSFPARTLGDYVAYARANPGRINYGTGGAGAISHLAGAWLHSLSNTQVTYIHHKSTGPMLLELQTGRIMAGSGLMVATLPMVKAGKLRALAALGGQRSPQMPDLPTVAEQGFAPYDYTGWIGFLGAGGTPPSIANRLSEAFNKAVHSPEIVAELAKQGSEPVGSTPAQFAQLITTELARWQKVVDEAGLKLEE